MQRRSNGYLHVLLASGLLFAGCGGGVADKSESHQKQSANEDFEHGPHGGRLLKGADDLSLELQIYEEVAPPRFRVYGYQSGNPLPAAELKAQVKIKRLGDSEEVFNLTPSGDFLTSQEQVKEPHSFDVSISAECRGKKLSWTYSSPEGRVSIPNDVAESAGIKVEKVEARKIARTLRIRGKILPSEHRLAHVMPRFAGVVKEGRKHIGDPVQKGEVLAIIESNQSLQPFEVRSQISGTVISGHLIVGEFVPENHLVYTVADLSEVWADFFVPLKDRFEVKIGQKVLIHAVGQEQTVEGVVSYLAPYADERSQAQLVRAIIPNESGALLAGTFVAGELIVEEVQAPVVVKRSAVHRFRSWDVVFVRFGDNYEVRPVILGRKDEQYVEILSGLKAGDEYVSENSFLIKADILKSGASHDH